ncbi:DUF998 domain-containing protein [Burkholderia sp. LMG 21824]|uniref:DUF998 domain-containing protein n=1 Tax=Burkholderia sp. LMG 21824 TaxID=3158172 RepID=UPI003C30B374
MTAVRLQSRWTRFGYVSGMLAPLWLAMGVTLVAHFYPGYSHIRQAMSELGAVGAPTHQWSPFINNFPLAFWFVAFGCAVWQTFPESRLARTSAVLLVVHGLANVVTGTWSCDVGCRLDAASSSQRIHNLAGLVMALSLLGANVLWTVLGKRVLGLGWLSALSAVTTLVCLATLPLMVQAAGTGGPFGLYQRINYGVSIAWVGVLAATLYSRCTRRNA